MTGQNARSEEARELRHLALQRAERRRVTFSVLLPFTIVLVIAVAIIGTVLLLRSPAQVSLLSDTMLTVLVLCPLVVCMFPLVVLSLVLVSMVNRWRPRSRSPLRRLEAWTALMEQNVDEWLGNVDERVLHWAVRFAPLRQLLTAFDQPAAEPSDEEIE
jgi:membrane protein implicated in regulation of membrane protease activity